MGDGWMPLQQVRHTAKKHHHAGQVFARAPRMSLSVGSTIYVLQCRINHARSWKRIRLSKSARCAPTNSNCPTFQTRQAKSRANLSIQPLPNNIGGLLLHMAQQQRTEPWRKLEAVNPVDGVKATDGLSNS